MTFTHIYFTMWEIVLGPKGGENAKGLQSSPFLAIHAKGGENIKPKAKRTAPPFQNKIFEMNFSNDVFSISINWYLCFT
jgi:hypothetical protein